MAKHSEKISLMAEHNCLVARNTSTNVAPKGCHKARQSLLIWIF